MLDMGKPVALPLAVELAGRRCVCIGGGTVAARRVPVLVGAGAVVTLIAPRLHPALEHLRAKDALAYEQREFVPGDLAGAFFVLAATGVAEVDAAVAAEGGAVGCLICVASDPARGNCEFMATIRRGPLLVGLETGGVAPALTVALRDRIEEALPPDLEEILAQVGALRAALREAIADPAERGRRWRAVAESGALAAALRGEAGWVPRIRTLLFP